jgi:hypothetical protein
MLTLFRSLVYEIVKFLSGIWLVNHLLDEKIQELILIGGYILFSFFYSIPYDLKWFFRIRRHFAETKRNGNYCSCKLQIITGIILTLLLAVVLTIPFIIVQNQNINNDNSTATAITGKNRTLNTDIY